MVLNELTELSPALTTNSSLPSGVRLVDPEESTIGNPNGGSDAAPLPPVATGDPVWVMVPSAWRVYMITALPASGSVRRGVQSVRRGLVAVVSRVML